MSQIQSISLVGKKNLHNYTQQLQSFFNSLSKFKIYFNQNLSEQLGYSASSDEELLNSDLIIVFGGDGTLLKIGRKVSNPTTKILSVNLGTLGFLTETEIDKLPMVFKSILEGKYQIDKRKLLDIKVFRQNNLIQQSLAMNEAVIHQNGKARLISLNIQVSGQNMCNLKSDGLIVSTSTGSTGHSLSAGGPIVHPHVNAILINPICPISLSNRPILVPSDRTIEINLEQHKDYTEKVAITVDGQMTFDLEYNDKIYMKESSHHISLIRMLDSNYYQSLRDKLQWS